MAQPAKETARRTSPDRARKTAVLIFIMVSVLFSLSLFICNYVVSRHYRSLESASRSFASAQKAAADLQTGSDYLTEKVRSFVVTGDLFDSINGIKVADVKRVVNILAGFGGSVIVLVLQMGIQKVLGYSSDGLTLENMTRMGIIAAVANFAAMSAGMAVWPLSFGWFKKRG